MCMRFDSYFFIYSTNWQIRGDFLYCDVDFVNLSMCSVLCFHFLIFIGCIELNNVTREREKERRNRLCDIESVSSQMEWLCVLFIWYSTFIENWFKSVSAFMRNGWSNNNIHNGSTKSSSICSIQFSSIEFSILCTWSRHRSRARQKIKTEKQKQLSNDSISRSSKNNNSNRKNTFKEKDEDDVNNNSLNAFSVC